MSFKYTQGQPQTAITPPALAVYCRSFKIDIAAGSGFTTATPYTLGVLPRGAQLVWGTIAVSTAVSGGTVSAATLGVTAGGAVLSGAANVFAAGTVTMSVQNHTGSSIQETTTEQAVIYTPSLTGSGATAGVMYITLFYVP